MRLESSLGLATIPQGLVVVAEGLCLGALSLLPFPHQI